MATKSELVRVRVSVVEKERLERQARAAGVSVSVFVRRLIGVRSLDGDPLGDARSGVVSPPAVAPAAPVEKTLGQDIVRNKRTGEALEVYVLPAAPVEESVSVSDAIAEHALGTAREVLARPVPPEARPHSIVTKRTFRPDFKKG